MKTYEYSAEEFMDHFDNFSPDDASPEPLMWYFLGYYLDASEARWKMSRFLAAIWYLSGHLAEVDKFITNDSEEFYLSPPIKIAVTRYFCGLQDEHLLAEPDQERILKMAREERKWMCR